MNSLKKVFVIVFVSSLLSLSACAKEIETTSVEASEVSIEKSEIKSAAVVKDTVTTSEVVEVASDVLETATVKPVVVENSAQMVKAEVEEAKVRTVAMTTDAIAPVNELQAKNEIKAESGTEASSQWVKIENDDKLETVKPSGTYAVPVSEELGLVTAEEFLGLDKHKGKVIYLDFWASWCIPCRDSFPFMNAVQEKYPDDLVVLAVNLDEDKANAEKFLEVYPANFEIIYDQFWQAGREYGIYGLPFSFIYNRNGELVGKHGGFKDGDEVNLDAALNNLITSGE